MCECLKTTATKTKLSPTKKTKILLTNRPIDLFEQIDFAQNISNQIIEWN